MFYSVGLSPDSSGGSPRFSKHDSFSVLQVFSTLSISEMSKINPKHGTPSKSE